MVPPRRRVLRHLDFRGQPDSAGAMGSAKWTQDSGPQAVEAQGTLVGALPVASEASMAESWGLDRDGLGPTTSPLGEGGWMGMANFEKVWAHPATEMGNASGETSWRQHEQQLEELTGRREGGARGVAVRGVWGQAKDRMAADRCCCVCMGARREFAFTPCGHRCVCKACATATMLAKDGQALCPVCRCDVHGMLRILD
eukprot:8053023-Pyramimonas_sp.AAC.1